MTYKEMKKNDSFTKLIEDLLKKSNRRFTGEKCEYKDLSVTERVNYIDSSLCTVLRWMDVIFKRPEKCGDEYWDKDALKDERTYPILDEYGDWKTMENRETAIDDLYKIVRMYIYILERFFMDGNSAVKDDYIAVVGLFKKMATDNSLDFYESHRRVEELYFLIHEKHDLEQYFDYEGIEILSEKLPDIDSKNIRYQYVGLKDIEEKKTYKNLKKFYDFIVDTYMSVLKHKADYTEELTEPEKKFIECIFNFSYYNRDIMEKLKNDRWELAHIEERKEIVKCMESMCDLDINILNKYIGANTTQELKRRFEDIKLKILNPITYRIFKAVEEIKAELPLEKSFQERISNDPDGDDAYTLRKIETKLDFVKNELIEINKKENDSLCDYIDISCLL